MKTQREWCCVTEATATPREIILLVLVVVALAALTVLWPSLTRAN